MAEFQKNGKKESMLTYRANEKPQEINRIAFEIYTVLRVVDELKSADLCIEHSNDFNDFRKDFVSRDVFEKEREEYCRRLDLPEDPHKLVQLLKKKLSDAANKLDENYLNNTSLSITDDGPKLHKFSPIPETAETTILKEAIKNRMQQKSILDILGVVESWTELHKIFGPLSGHKTKLQKPSERLISTLLCYGCNLGPKQTSQSIKELGTTVDFKQDVAFFS
ncbi:MAG: Tn3 family transposase [Cellvibrionales bacterium]|nr:Tn3 family transposase [Cellvibrionales bacterium]